MTAPVFELSRRFEAPPALVWRIWTEPDLVARWYGPGVETVLHQFEPKTGGLWLLEMKMNAQSMYQRVDYVEVDPPSKLVMLMSNSDADWNVIPNPMMPNWPTVLLTTVTFEADSDGTVMTLKWSPHGATDEENAAFEAAVEQLGQGWGAGFDIIGEIVAELTASS